MSDPFAGTDWHEKALRWGSSDDAEDVAQRLSRRANMYRNSGAARSADALEQIAFMENASLGDYLVEFRE